MTSWPALEWPATCLEVWRFTLMELWSELPEPQKIQKDENAPVSRSIELSPRGEDDGLSFQKTWARGKPTGKPSTWAATGRVSHRECLAKYSAWNDEPYHSDLSIDILVKSDPLFTLNIDELRTFIGRLVFSGHLPTSCMRLYWSEAMGLASNFYIRQAMTQSRYLKMKRHLYVQENNTWN